MADEEATNAGSTGNDPGGTGSQGEGNSEKPVSRAEFETMLKDFEDRFKQSNRDVITDRVTKETKELRDELSALTRLAKDHPELLKEGVDPKALIRDKFIDLQLAELSDANEEPGGGSPQALPNSGSPLEDKTLAAGISEILKERGLSGNEPEIVQFMSDSRGKGLYTTLKGLDSLAETIAQRNAGDPGSILPLGDGAKPPPPDLLENYAKEMYAARGDRVAAKDIQAKYKKLGLDVRKVNLVR